MTEPDLGSPGFKADPFPYFAALRRDSPVHQVRLGRRKTAWLITRYDDAVAALGDGRFAKDPSRASGSKPLWLPGMLRALTRNMLDVDEPDHRRLRELVQKAFTPGVVEEMRPRIESLVNGFLDDVARKRDVDLIADFALPLPVTIIAEMLGVAERDRPRFQRWSQSIVAADASAGRLMLAIPNAIAFILFLRRLVRQKRKRPGNDLLSQMCQVEEAGDRLSNDELLAMSFLLLIAGHETTVNLIGNGVIALLQHPAELRRLRDDPSLLAGAIEELLRHSGPLQLATERYAMEDISIGGALIPRGALVYVALASANRDESRFADADRVDVTRSPNRHLAFGHGIHYCLGAPLARLEAGIAIGALLRRFQSLEIAGPLTWRRGLVMRGVDALPMRVS